MMKVHDAFDQMGKRAVPDVMQQSGGQDGGPLIRGNIVFRLQFVENAQGEMQCAEAVRKTRVLGSLIGQKSDAKLSYPAQALKFGRVYQTHQKLTFGVIGSKADYIMN